MELGNLDERFCVHTTVLIRLTISKTPIESQALYGAAVTQEMLFTPNDRPCENGVM